ncbi:MAG: hypothetical protein RI908_1512 [Actinomycetota bacterium]
MTCSLFMASLTTEAVTVRVLLVGLMCLVGLILLGASRTRPSGSDNRAMMVGELATQMTAASRSSLPRIGSLRSILALAVLSIVGGVALGLLASSAMIVVINGA